MSCPHRDLAPGQPRSIFIDGWAVRDGDGWKTYEHVDRPAGKQLHKVLICAACGESFLVVREER